MVSLIAAPSPVRFIVSHRPTSYLNPPRFFPIVFVITPPKRLYPKRKLVNPRKQNQFLFEFSDSSEVVGMCKGWEGGGDPALELEVLEFMKKSEDPDKFPSKRELIGAGRGDLVEAILKRGGWMSIGWEDDETERERIEDGLSRNLEVEFETNGKNIAYEGEGRRGTELNEGRLPEGISSLGNSSSAASSSGRSLEMTEEDESGIEGILNRLERQRSLSFDLYKRNIGGMNHSSRKLDKDELSGRASKDVDSCHPDRSRSASLGHDGPLFHNNSLSASHSGLSSSSLLTDTWRARSVSRAGTSDTKFEAAEIDFGGNANGRMESKHKGGRMALTTDIKLPVVEQRKDNRPCVEQITKGDVKTRLRRLEVELSSTLGSLRSNKAGVSEKVKENLCEDLRQLSDASEFQENDVIHAQSKLRSLRAKLAILEGKMALAIIDAQKILDEKQKRINDARRALQLLRTVCIVWPNAGSEVLLAGSFDGWATQRKMERLSTGVFSLQLKLYSGKYEIKFIVDGSWKVDPLRPIVNNNGFENNLLIVT